MNNKNEIEEDTKILINITKQEFNNPAGWSGYYDSELKKIQQAIKNILADREEWKNKAEWFKRCCNKNFNITQQLQSESNKYDNLVEKIKERIKSVERCYQDLIEPYFDKSINTINTSCMTKKEKEEFINKSNCLMIQKTVYEEVLELLDTQRSL